MSALKVQVYQFAAGECISPAADDLLIIERAADRRTQFIKWSKLIEALSAFQSGAMMDSILLKNQTTGKYHRITLVTDGGALIFDINPIPEL